MTDAGDAACDLPDDLADCAGSQLMAASGPERAAVLDTLVAANPQHERALRQLAADLGRVDSVFAGHDARRAAAADRDTPEHIGGHRVIRRLGAGAFGVVYLCAQQHPVAREVAVKVVRPGAAGPETLQRFAAERQLLAALNHPTITPVFEAGELPDGRPYFVMEYVDGVPMRRYCDDAQLTVDARIGLFLELCRGIEHAHRRGIVHRDLKPANVLVVERDAGPVPKIIDFGIAKALSGSPAGGDVPTEAGRIVGTPGYMSPEQAAGRIDDVDARADVFALGVMLYELLTGELPWVRRSESTDSEPPRPSDRVASDDTSASTQAERRRTSPQKLVSRLRGDLDCIVLKALAHERQHRYASAMELASDLERHLRGEPITARPTRLGRRAVRLLRRHRVAVAAAVAACSLALGTWISLHFAAQADERSAAVDAAQQQVTAARGEAQRLSTEAEAAARALLSRANDRQLLALPASAPARQALAQEALSFYDRFLRERPTAPELREGRARALETLSRVNRLIGQYDAAIRFAGESVDEARALLADDEQNFSWRGVLANAQLARARALRGASRHDAARADLEAALVAYELCFEQAPRRYAATLIGALLDRASSLDRDDESEAQLAALERAVAIGESGLAEHADPELQGALADACGYLAIQRIAHGELAVAEAALERAAQLLAGLPEDPRSGSVYHTLAKLAAARGDAAASIAAAQKGIGVVERWSEREPDRPAIRGLLANLHGLVADQLSATGEHEAAANAGRAMIAVTRDRVARFPGDPTAVGELAGELTWHALALFTTGHRRDLAEAEQCARESIALLAGADSGIDRRLLLLQRCKSLAQLGLVLDGRGDPAAPAHWQEAAAVMHEFAAEFGVDTSDAFEFTQAPLRLCAACLAAGRTDAAGEALATAEALLAAHGGGPDQTKNAIEARRLGARLAVQCGDLDGAAAAAERLRAEDSGWRSALAAADVAASVWRAARAARPPLPAAAAYRDRAIPCLEGAIEALEDAVVAAPADLWVTVPLDQCRVALAELLSDRGEHERARTLLTTALPGLERAREDAHANCLDEQLFARGQALFGTGAGR